MLPAVRFLRKFAVGCQTLPMNDCFDFKPFRIYHDRCAMRVGTDGVLLGAWFEVPAGSRVLDVGAGSGLIAMMAAMRGAGEVVGLEIDAEAAAQARDNVALAAGVLPCGVMVETADVLTYATPSLFDVVVSNPPFHVEQTAAPDKRRAQARQADLLPYDRLIAAAARLLRDGGSFQVVWPYGSASDFLMAASTAGFSLRRQTVVVTKDGARPKRVLLHLVKAPYLDTIPRHATLVLFDADGRKTPEYQSLTGDFYL